MRRRPRLVELLDRQVIDSDNLDALVDEELRASLGEVCVLGVEPVVRIPEGGIRRAQQDAEVLPQAGGRQVDFGDPAPVGQIYHAGPPDQQFQG
jgi:hypothetical protein